MTPEQEKVMTSCWRVYLNPRDDDEYFDPPIAYARGFEDGARYQIEILKGIMGILTPKQREKQFPSLCAKAEALIKEQQNGKL